MTPLNDPLGLRAVHGRGRFSLPQVGTAVSQAYRPPPLEVPRHDYAKEVVLRYPKGWRDLPGLKEVDLVFDEDDSGSMYWIGGDPKGVRRAAALSVVKLLQAGSKGSRVSVVHWGSWAPEHLALPLTDARQGPIVKRALEIPPTLGGNNFPASLARCRELLQASSPKRIPLIFVITDGIEEVGPAAATELSQLPEGCVHVLLVDHSHGCDPALEAGWNCLPLGSFTRLELLDTELMSWQIAEVLAQAVGTHMPPLQSKSSNKRKKQSNGGAENEVD